MHIYPIFLEATGYYDWLYGLQRLFREGAKPQVVVLGVGVDSFLANSVRQDYAPLLLFDLRDSLGVASDLKMDRTAASNLFTGSFECLLGYTHCPSNADSPSRCSPLPRARRATEATACHPAAPSIPDHSEFSLERLRELCEAHGAKLIILFPPTRRPKMRSYK